MTRALFRMAKEVQVLMQPVPDAKISGQPARLPLLGGLECSYGLLQLGLAQATEKALKHSENAQLCIDIFCNALDCLSLKQIKCFL